MLPPSKIRYKGSIYQLVSGAVEVEDHRSFKDKYGFDKWVDFSAEDLRRDPVLLQRLYDLIKIAYSDLRGGHVGVTSPMSLVGDNLILHAIDLDNDPYPDAVVTWKIKDPGQKITGLGHDGGRLSKREVVNEFGNLINRQGYYAEVSPPISDVVWKRWPGVSIISHPAAVSAILGKEIEWFGDYPGGDSPRYGWYKRSISGFPQIKILIGIPFVPSPGQETQVTTKTSG